MKKDRATDNNTKFASLQFIIFAFIFMFVLCIYFVSYYFVGFAFFISHSFFSPLFTSVTTFVSVIYLLFRFLCLFLSTCPLHLLFFYPSSFNGFLISNLFFFGYFSFFHTNLSFFLFNCFTILLSFLQFICNFGFFPFFSTWCFPFFFLPTLSILLFF
jgi:hypothetical protein